MNKPEFEQMLAESFAVTLAAESTIEQVETLEEIQRRYDWAVQR